MKYHLACEKGFYFSVKAIIYFSGLLGNLYILYIRSIWSKDVLQRKMIVFFCTTVQQSPTLVAGIFNLSFIQIFIGWMVFEDFLVLPVHHSCSRTTLYLICPSEDIIQTFWAAYTFRSNVQFSRATFFGGLKPVLSRSDRRHIDSDRNRSKSYLQIQDWTCGFLLTSNILLLGWICWGWTICSHLESNARFFCQYKDSFKKKNPTLPAVQPYFRELLKSWQYNTARLHWKERSGHANALIKTGFICHCLIAGTESATSDSNLWLDVVINLMQLLCLFEWFAHLFTYLWKWLHSVSLMCHLEN